MRGTALRAALLGLVVNACGSPIDPDPDPAGGPTPVAPGGAGGGATSGRPEGTGGGGGGGAPSPTTPRQSAETKGSSPDAADGGASAPGAPREPADHPDAGPARDGEVSAEAGAPGPSCVDGQALLCEGFETTAADAVPAGWTRVGTGVGAAEDGATPKGTRALKVTGGNMGLKRISRRMSIPGTHWGRIYYKAGPPAPRPTSGVIHSTFVTLFGTSPLGGNAEWRVVDTVENLTGRHQFLYNVQPFGRGEFGKGSSYDFAYDGKWHCAEWHVDAATQSYQFFLDGTEVRSIAINNGAGNLQRSEIPTTFTAIAVGWTSYQRAPAPGFTAWFDDVAVDAKRIGCGN